MSSKRNILAFSLSYPMRNVFWLLFLLVILGMLVWHAIDWDSNGMYPSMLTWLKSGKGYLTVVYNVGFISLVGFVLSLTISGVTRLVSKHGRKDNKS